MQKALTQMNLQLANVISDVVGETGQKILRAILAGERDGHKLAALRNSRIRASDEEIARSLQGSWRSEHLFALRQALDRFDFIGLQLTEVDGEIEGQLRILQAHDGEPGKPRRRGGARNAPKFDLRTQLYKVCGVDLTRIDGIDVTTALAVVSEVGTDLSRFPGVGHFTSWLGLCPGTRITGGKVMSGRTKRCANRAAEALRMAAAALRTSKSALGAYFRRMCSRMDRAKAITAAAHKLARLIYTMLTRGEEYTDKGQEYYEEKYRERVVHNLSQRAAKLGMRMIPIDQATS
jgi:transposase